MLALLTKLAYREAGISDNEVIKQTTNSRHSCSLNHRHVSILRKGATQAGKGALFLASLLTR